MRRSLDARRRAIVRALTRATDRRGDDQTTDTVADLVVQVDRLSRHVDEMRTGAVASADLPAADPADDEDVPEHPTVPPLTPAKVSDHAFDVLLGVARSGTDTGSDAR
jgi:outer membrane murein-binding lipoprotein Lpp